MLHHCPEAPRLLVGCKMDLRTDKKFLETVPVSGARPVPVTTTQGQRMAKVVRADRYLEVSAKMNNWGISRVFEEAARLVISPPKNHKKKRRECKLM